MKVTTDFDWAGGTRLDLTENEAWSIINGLRAAGHQMLDTIKAAKADPDYNVTANAPFEAAIEQSAKRYLALAEQIERGE